MHSTNTNPSSASHRENISLPADQHVRFVVPVDHGSFSPNHWHDAIEVIYNLEGTTIVTLPDATITLNPGEFILINSGVIHASRCPSSGNRTILMQIPDQFLCAYVPEDTKLWFSIDFQNPGTEIQHRIADLNTLLLHMMDLFLHKPDGYLLSFHRALFEFLEILYLHFRAELPEEYRTKNERILSRLDAVLSYTHEHYASPIALSEAAAVVALQPEYFCRFFRQNMGMTYLQYLNDYRLSRFYQDLIDTDLPVLSLTERHGFTNDKLFHRLFRERFRMTPLQARKAARNTNF